jgi:hypothetical protein
MTNQSTPSNQVSGLTDLSYVVAEVQNELNDYSDKLRQRLLGLGISVLRDIRIYNQSAVQVAYMSVNEAGVVELPRDYIDYIQIGVKDHGQLRTLTLDNNMLLDRGESCAEPTRKMERYGTNLGNYNRNMLFGGYYNGVFVPTYYGIGGGRNSAYYKIDKAANRIQFNGYLLNSEVVLVYKSTGIGPNTVFGWETVNPVKAGIQYKRVEHDLTIPMNQKMLLRDTYDQEIKKLRSFVQKFTKSEYLDVYHKHKKQTPKQ